MTAINSLKDNREAGGANQDEDDHRSNAHGVLIGLLYQSPENIEEGKRLLMHAAMLGDMFAQSTLGFHQLWKGQSPEEQALGVEWLTAAAQQDHKYAIYNVGEAHLRGKGTPKNTPEAVSWYEKGIALGSADCQSAMGYLHFMGRGVP